MVDFSLLSLDNKFSRSFLLADILSLRDSLFFLDESRSSSRLSLSFFNESRSLVVSSSFTFSPLNSSQRMSKSNLVLFNLASIPSFSIRDSAKRPSTSSNFTSNSLEISSLEGPTCGYFWNKLATKAKFKFGFPCKMQKLLSIHLIGKGKARGDLGSWEE